MDCGSIVVNPNTPNSSYSQLYWVTVIACSLNSYDFKCKYSKLFLLHSFKQLVTVIAWSGVRIKSDEAKPIYIGLTFDFPVNKHTACLLPSNTFSINKHLRYFLRSQYCYFLSISSIHFQLAAFIM